MKHPYKIMNAHKEMRGLEYLVYSALSLSLLIVLVLLPLAPAFADEITPQSFETPVVSAPETGQGKTEGVSEVDAPIPDTDTIGVTEKPVEEDAGLTTSDVAIVSETVDIPVSNEAITDRLPIEDTLATDTESTMPDATTTDSVVVPDTTVTDIPTGEDVVTSSIPIIATTTQDQEHVVNVVTNDENKFSFSKDECTTVGDGTFYCATGSTQPQVLHTDRVFSAVDADGDKEIYVEKGGELTQLTNNTLEDDAPYFDEVSNTVVWHRLIDGRYQIMQYNFDNETETQLTNDSFNNMQPSVFGDAFVWQGWVGNDWEIFFQKGGERKMLTDNTTHDIAPSINGTHIVWQSFENEAWRMKVYDIRTGLIDTIEDTGGGSIENPRFVLVYDAKMETGDIETRGYDLKSGEVLDLASRPTPVPEEIPDPDQTGEKRALVAPSTQPKQKTDSDENDDIGTTTISGTGNPDDGDLVIPALDEGTDTLNRDTASSTIQDTSDVVIPSFDTGTSTPDVDHIKDLVLEPYVPLENVLEEESPM